MGNPWFSSPSLKNIPPEYFLRYARKSRTAAHLECARLRRILRRTLVPLRPRFPGSPFMAWPSKSATALWENAPQGHFLIPQGELRTADVYRPALPVVLGLRCECQLYGTTASRVVVFYGSGAQCGSTTCFCGAHLRARRRAWRYCMKRLKTIYLFYILIFHYYNYIF